MVEVLKDRHDYVFQLGAGGFSCCLGPGWRHNSPLHPASHGGCFGIFPRVPLTMLLVSAVPTAGSFCISNVRTKAQLEADAVAELAAYIPDPVRAERFLGEVRRRLGVA